MPRALVRLCLSAVTASLMTIPVLAQGQTAPSPAPTPGKKEEHASGLQEFVHGAPASPSPTWTISAGGRIYDTWWDALDRKKPTGNHPAYPATSKRSGANTWRCVECHGWDYKGKDGIYGSGDRFTGIKGIRAARSKGSAELENMLRAAPHSYTKDMISDAELKRLVAFLRDGQHDADRYIDRKSGAVKGSVPRGAAVFQTTCAACHGFDGRLLNWGTKDEPGYIGTEANKFPAEVLHKIRNSHPGAAMINLRALPLQDAVDLLAYARTLPIK